jgi:hypothetical protein
VFIILKDLHERIPLINFKHSPSYTPETGQFFISEQKQSLIQKINLIFVQLILTLGSILGSNNCARLKTLIAAEREMSRYEDARLPVVLLLENAVILPDSVIKNARKSFLKSLNIDCDPFSLNAVLKEPRFEPNSLKEGTSDLNRTIKSTLTRDKAIELKDNLQSENAQFIKAMRNLRSTLRRCSGVSACITYLFSKKLSGKIQAVKIASENLFTSLNLRTFSLQKRSCYPTFLGY